VSIDSANASVSRMSVYAAKEIGRLFAAVDLLQVNGLLSPSEARQECLRVCKRAAKLGVGVATTDVTGKPLDNAVRVHWMDSRGVQRNRLYPAFNLAHEKGSRR
jgi:hypothetical protein